MPHRDEQEAGSENQTVSSRKAQANRQNASKSTGPKTPRGKQHSRMNALKHGLFAMDLYISTITEWEDRDEYRNLLKRLARDYQPVGAAEELEVHRIASCWWKLSRAWRYESAEIAGELVRKQALTSPGQFSSEDQVRYVLLKEAESEITSTGKISDKLKEEMFADAGLRRLWDSAQKEYEEFYLRRTGLSAAQMTKAKEAKPDVRTSLLLGTTRQAANVLARQYSMVLSETAKLAHDQAAILRSDSLDKVLRAEAAAERSLNHAINRLERLQQRRRGDEVPARSVFA